MFKLLMAAGVVFISAGFFIYAGAEEPVYKNIVASLEERVADIYFDFFVAGLKPEKSSCLAYGNQKEGSAEPGC